MQIVNFIKDSTVECSPFQWGLTLFSFGCNFRCKMCRGYNYEKVTNPNYIIGDAVSIIQNNVTPLHDCIVFIGGEPTIWEDKLIKTLEYCHEQGLKTKIFSNGFKYDVIEEINNRKLCDAWSIDFKGLHNISEEFGVPASDYLINVGISIADILEHKVPLEVRTTFYIGNESHREDIRRYVRENFPNATYIEQEDVRELL